MKVAYADPPYLGCGELYAKEHPDALAWNDPETHRALIGGLMTEFPDAWAMSLSVPSLRVLLPMCPIGARVGAWVKPFASFKPNVNPAYAWEPVVWWGGRRRTREAETVRDWCSVPITLKRGLTGAKPDEFCFWLFDLLGLLPGDDFRDLFPGTGGVTAAWESFQRQRPLFPSRPPVHLQREGGEKP